MEAMEEPRWLDETEQRAWRGFLHMTELLKAQLGRDLQKETGLSDADYSVLVHLSEIDGRRMRMSDLAGRLLWSKSRLSHQVARMEDRGLVRREECPTDARGSFAVLTDKGFKVIEHAAPFHVESVRRHLIDRLTRDDLLTLVRIADTVVAPLAALMPESGCLSVPADDSDTGAAPAAAC